MKRPPANPTCPLHEVSLWRGRAARALARSSCALAIPALALVGACQASAPDGQDRSESDITGAAVSCRRVDDVKQQCTYKTENGVALEIDVYRKAGTEVRPVLLWLHGGALIFGSRSELPAAQRNRYLDRGYVVASVDYRLAPETKLAQIHADVEDAYKWLRANSAAFQIDKDRVGIVGHSAGGYLTLTAGARLSPRPRALVAFYGYGDIRWYTKPGMAEEGSRCPADPLKGYPAGRPIAHAGAGTAGASYAPVACGNAEEEPEAELEEGGGDAESGEDGRLGIYSCSREKGYWPEVVGGRRLDAESAWFEQFEAIRHVSRDYPATMLLHGPTDDDVPFGQSKAMATALGKAGVDVEFLSAQRWSHGFDEQWCDPSVQCAFDRVTRFLDRHLGVGGADAPRRTTELPDMSCDVGQAGGDGDGDEEGDADDD
jgi:acetyl esterase/lipase